MNYDALKTRLVTAHIRKLIHGASGFTPGFGESCHKIGDLVFSLLPNEAVLASSVLELQFLALNTSLRICPLS